MSKRLIMILALAFVVGIAFTAYAEVQNVKVSGDIVMQGVARNNFDLDKGTAGDRHDDDAAFTLSQVRVRVDADLTDNVVATVRLINEKLWGVEDTFSDSSELNLDLAFVTLKEFLYSPLTVTVGRQELKLGNGLVVGARYSNSIISPYTTYPYSSNSTPLAYDLTERKAFDAIKVILNYDPLTIEAFTAKLTEAIRTTDDNNDVNLYAINASYAIDKKSAVQVYLVAKIDSNGDRTDKIYVPGILYTGSPMDNLALSLEAAMQKGNLRTTADSKRSAWAIQAMANYVFADKKMTPSLGFGYTYLSGDKTSDKKITTWDPMFEDQAPNNITNVLFAQSNAQVINIQGSIKPKEDLTLAAKYGNYRLAQTASGIVTCLGNTYLFNDSKDLGNALDLTATYDYTEDVQLGLTWGMFKPGKAFLVADRGTATQLIGSMKVTF